MLKPLNVGTSFFLVRACGCARARARAHARVRAIKRQTHKDMFTC